MTSWIERLEEAKQRLAEEEQQEKARAEAARPPILIGTQTNKWACRNKSTYSEEWAAKNAAERMMRNDPRSADRLVPFKCSNCGHYHVGRLNEENDWRRST
jgi:hypothetical protein